MRSLTISRRIEPDVGRTPGLTLATGTKACRLSTKNVFRDFGPQRRGTDYEATPDQTLSRQSMRQRLRKICLQISR